MNKQERRKQDIEWIKYIGNQIKSYWVSYIETILAVLFFEYLGFHDIALLVGFIMISFITGVITTMALLRQYCLKHGINPETLKYNENINKGDSKE